MFILRNQAGIELGARMHSRVCRFRRPGRGRRNGAPEFAYSGDHGPGFWGETPGWEACAGTSRTQRQSPIDINHVVFDRHLGRAAAAAR